MFARRVGNVLKAFSCVPRVAPIMEMDSCFAEIPILVDGSVQFIDIETLVLQVLKSWVEINRHVTPVKSTPKVKHREGEIFEALISELYSSRTLKQWENSLQYLYFLH